MAKKEGHDEKSKKSIVRKKQSIKIENDDCFSKIIYQSEKITIANHQDRLCFQIESKELKEQILTFDVFEAVAAILRIQNYDRNFWNLKISEKDFDIIPIKAIYWLSGGNDEWSNLDNYNISWSIAAELFEKEFEESITNDINKCKTLGDIKKLILKTYNFSTFYEYAMSKDFAK